LPRAGALDYLWRVVEGPIPLRTRLAAALIDRSPDWSASAASRIVGSAARIPMPAPLSRAAVAAYVRWFGVETADVEPDALAEGFRCFNSFFTRSLRGGARPIDGAADVWVSPCDGTLRECSPIEDGATVTAKGHAYGIGELLADEDDARGFIGGWHTTIYLHPRDYHRVHVPCRGRVVGLTLVPGRLLPVTDASVAREPRLFAINERMVHRVETAVGPLAVVMIAAFGVGNMSCAYADVTPHPREVVHAQIGTVEVDKGDELGVFNLGSTVVVLSPPGVRPRPDVARGKVAFGEALWEVSP
jgi:phosphatidylserine decarboxylase